MQSKQEKVINTFTKGLITEAGELTFPPDASVDELNCAPQRDGSRRRRRAISYESSNDLSSFTLTQTDAVTNGTWTNVGGDGSLQFIVVQNGSNLYFFDKTSAPYSANEDSETVDLSAYEVTSGSAATYKCSFTSIKGYLVVASQGINTIFIERDNGTGNLTVTEIDFRVRDFEWQSSITTFDTAIATGSVSDERKYDTYNAGWFGNGSAALTTYTSAETKYPPLTHPWYSGKNSSGAFSVSEFKNVGAGTSITGNGYFILDFFNKDRATVSGIGTLPVETEASRFSTVASFAGRIFYSGLSSSKNAGTILFSQLIYDSTVFGECLQKNDPTSEYLSDLLDTDGGQIVIPEAYNINKLHPFGNSLYVFAENGVWVISGVDDIFRATGYSVNKITEAGLNTLGSFVSVDGVPFWWSSWGIHTVSIDAASGRPQEENISISTVQTYWNNISNKQDTVSHYDRVNKRIYWGTRSNSETISGKINDILVLDVALSAFVPWTISDEVTNSSYIIGFNGTINDPFIVLVADGATLNMTIAKFDGTDFLDWGSADYLSYAEAGYDFSQSLERRKTMPYITVFCRKTEENWIDSGDGLTPDLPSSLLVSAHWNFRNNASTTLQQAYRIKTSPNPVVGVFSYPESVIATRLKLRGKGRVVKVRVESESGKDFILLGYSMVQGINASF